MGTITARKRKDGTSAQLAEVLVKGRGAILTARPEHPAESRRLQPGPRGAS